MRRARLLFAAVALVLFALAPVCATVTGGVFGLKSAATKHFDIIYRENSAKTAAMIFENCEDVYSDLVQFFGTDPDFRIPVVVTSSFKSLNAYYSVYPANHIVLFDTVTSVGELSNFPDTILWIFRHEMTHAFEYNIRGNFVRGLSNVFGDIVTLSPLLFMYPSFTEGGAVLFESLEGYGRLNDSYAMQIVRQAKIEGLFPSWLDVAGARDTWPGGYLYYNFAGAFLGYLGLTYGFDNVAQLYVDFGKPGWADTTDSIIREHIGISAEQAWQHFFTWIPVPSDVASASAVEASGLGHDGRYYGLKLVPDGSLWFYDLSTWSVCRLDGELSAMSRALVLPSEEPAFDISSDGCRLLVSYITRGRSCVRVYDLLRDRLVHNFESSFRDKDDPRAGCFVKLDGKEYILIYANRGQETFFKLYDAETYKIVEEKSLALGRGVTASLVVAIGEGRVAFICNLASEEHIAVLDISDMSVKLVSNPDKISIMSLSMGSEGNLCFCWYPSDSRAPHMGRYGELILPASDEEGYSMRLSTTDVSGGMEKCIRKGDDVVFVYTGFDGMTLSSLAYDRLSFGEPVSLALESAPMPQDIDTEALFAASKGYHGIKYFKDGVLIPLALIDSASLNTVAFGATWITSEPTETYTNMIAAGYASGNVFGSWNFSSTSFVPYTLFAAAAVGTGLVPEADGGLGKGEFALDTGVSASLAFELRHSGETLGLSDTFEFMFYKEPGKDALYEMHNKATLQYSYSVRTGTNPYDVRGFSVAAYLDNLDPGVSAVVRFPRLATWVCEGPDITNFPASFSLNALLHPASGVLGLSASADVVLYSREIQRAVSFLGLYFQRFITDIKYTAIFVTPGNSFSNTLALTAKFSLSPVLGSYLTKTKISMGVTASTDFVSGLFVKFAFGTDL